MLLGLLTAVLALAVGFLVFVNQLEDREVLRVPHAEGIVALTGGTDRIADAVNLVASGHADRLLISGVNPTITGEEIVRHTPNARGWLNCCIDLGYEALNTVGNAAETRRWAQQHRIHNRLIIVTSNYHMPRALLEIGRQLPNLELVPFPVVSEKSRGSIWGDAQLARTIALEYLKYVVALARPAFVETILADGPTRVSATGISPAHRATMRQ